MVPNTYRYRKCINKIPHTLYVIRIKQLMYFNPDHFGEPKRKLFLKGDVFIVIEK